MAYKIVVLDDDPTGVQTVHDIAVYTDWEKASIEEGFKEKEQVFFILTNSRAMTESETRQVHTEIATQVAQVSKALDIPYILVSRGDSTLRGHYPLETEVLKEISEQYGPTIDGEVICPYFKAGGRITMGNIHYIQTGEICTPVAETEFAKDKTFGYKHSNLCDYIEEKTKGMYKAKDVICISLESIRQKDFKGIVAQLNSARDFQKIVVNAVQDEDLEIVCQAIDTVIREGKHFIFRVAANFVKTMGGIQEKPLLTHDELIKHSDNVGGMVVIGSHTQKTNQQLEALTKLPDIQLEELNSDLVLVEGGLEKEVERVITIAEAAIVDGKTIVVYTKRKLLSLEGDTEEDALRRSVQISEALQQVVGKLSVTPSFVVAKGGITSSDVGTKALKVKKAMVLGQIRPGVPVWQAGSESKFPGIPYIIFPGNVGAVEDLRYAVEELVK